MAIVGRLYILEYPVLPRRVSWLWGLVGALIVHALLFSTALLGSAAHKAHKPELNGPGASASASKAEPTMTMVLLQLPVITQESSEETGSHGSTPKESSISLVSPDPRPSLEVGKTEEEQQATQVDAGDAEARAKLFGMYAGQVDARIKRAWRRPRSAVSAVAQASSSIERVGSSSDDVFRCQVRIYQDNQGNVTETELISCNGTVAWQKSLLRAIDRASPLPAPPSPTVFTNALTLTLEGHAYRDGMLADDYESELKTIQTLVDGRHGDSSR